MCLQRDTNYNIIGPSDQMSKCKLKSRILNQTLVEMSIVCPLILSSHFFASPAMVQPHYYNKKNIWVSSLIVQN